MIDIQTRRIGPIVVAATVNDLRRITVAIALTRRAAEGRLCRRLDREDAHR